MWDKLPKIKQKRHTFAKCKECALTYKNAQQTFPGVKFTPGKSLAECASVLVEQNKASKSEQTSTKEILLELDTLYQATYGHSFTQSLVECKTAGIQNKPTTVERKRAKRTLQRECRDQITKQLHRSDAITVLAEGHSLASYQRQRIAQSFESPKTTRERHKNTEKKHSPSSNNVQWDKENLLPTLQNWPQGKIINWSAIARQYHVPGKNKGQVVKEFAKENGIEVFKLDNRPCNTRLRARMLRMPSGQISVPVHRTVEGVKNDWKEMIEKGELTLGEPCYPHTLRKYTIQNGELQKSETVVYGRKISLLEIRENLLHRHESIMYLQTDEEIAGLSKECLLEQYKQRNITLPDDLSEQNLRDTLKQYERTRHIAIWHDHSTILGRGYILLTAKILYDSAVFKRSIPNAQSIQAYVEEPEISIIAMSSSTIHDQAALISDRVNCIQDMSVVLNTSKGIPINDRLAFFYGDKPAAQFERGTQVGGHYPCGACGAHVSRFDDFAHLSNFSWRGLQELQALVTKGTYSKILCICCSTILYTCSLQLLTNYSYRSSWERGRKC